MKSIKQKKIQDGLEILKSILKSNTLTTLDKTTVKKTINSFEDKLANIKLRLGIIGEFNSGKSTLLNAILDRKVSATGDRPCTPVPIEISYSPKDQMIIQFGDTKRSVPLSEYEKYTTFGLAPEGISNIQIGIGSNFLQKYNISIIDTPGINANNEDHTKITEQTLQSLNAAILLMYSKQPASKSTLEFLQRTSSQVSKIFVCISKSNFLDSSQLERIIQELPERIYKHSGVNVGKVWPIWISETGNGKDFYQFLEHLQEFMINEYESVLSNDLSKVLLGYYKMIEELIEKQSLKEETNYYSLKDKLATSIEHEFESIEKHFIAQVKEHLKPDETLKKVIKKKNTKAKQIFEEELEEYVDKLTSDYIFSNRLSDDDVDKIHTFAKKHIKHFNKQNSDIVHKSSIKIINQIVRALVKETYNSVKKINGMIKNSDLKNHLAEVPFDRALKYLTPKIEFKSEDLETAGVDEYSSTSRFWLGREKNAEQFKTEMVDGVSSALDSSQKGLVQSFNTTRDKCEITGKKFIRIIKKEYQNELKLGIKNNNIKIKNSEDKIETLEGLAKILKKQSAILQTNSQRS